MTEPSTPTIFSHKLRKPILDGKGGTVEEISFREPTAGDIVRCGNPVKYAPHDEDQEITFEEGKLLRMLAALSGILPPFLERMDPNDFMDCAWGVAAFFLPGMRRAPATP